MRVLNVEGSPGNSNLHKINELVPFPRDVVEFDDGLEQPPDVAVEA